MNNRRVLVTGLGLETCLGTSVDEVWANVRDGVPGITAIDSFDASDLPCRVAGVVPFRPEQVLSPTEIRRTSRHQQLLYSSIRKATGDISFADPFRVALIVGSGGAGLTEVAEAYSRIGPGEWQKANRFLPVKAFPNMAAAFVAQKMGVLGPTYTVTSACAAATDAIGLGLRLIRHGVVDVALVGGVEAWITWSGIGTFAQLQVLTSCPPEEAASACRPFDARRDGMVPAEGAGCLVLEERSRALDRGASVLAEVLGAAATCDAGSPLAPRDDGRAASAAIRLALADAGIDAREVDHVNAHGTATRLNDIIETRVLKDALGDHVWDVPITATKSVLGHTLGACGAIEAATSALALRDQFVPPTANLECADPECDLDYTPKVGRSVELQHVLKTSFGLGGQNSALVLGRA